MLELYLGTPVELYRECFPVDFQEKLLQNNSELLLRE